ncbi:MAG: GntR family transcriptional regulator [Actinomycetota bacterium]|nr:GntR family transcriptional regulator [Actinomycetota bacterium]
MTDREGPRFDPAGEEPVYLEIARDLVSRIEDGTYPPGGRIPSLDDLVHEYGAARETVRKAVRQLADRGLVRISRGKGTFVSQPGGPVR